jgi:hypothetical protein
MNLTPKEKAKELIERFEKLEVISADHMACASIDTKQCALINVNEMYNMASELDNIKYMNYLTDVKTEIEKL